MDADEITGRVAKINTLCKMFEAPFFVCYHGLVGEIFVFSLQNKRSPVERHYVDIEEVEDYAYGLLNEFIYEQF